MTAGRALQGFGAFAGDNDSPESTDSGAMPVA